MQRLAKLRPNGEINTPNASARREREARSGAALGKYANNDSTSGKSAKSSRKQRYSLRQELWTFSSVERIRKCGRVNHAPRITLKASADGERAGFSGLVTCGSVWACPVCSAKISATRSNEVATLLERAADEGLHVSMLTMTMRHRKGQRLTDLWDGLSYAWRAAVTGRQWQSDRETFGLEGHIRATEVTHGKNGWHVHIHTLLLTTQPLTATGLPSGMFERFSRALSRKGFESVKDSGGFDFTTCEKGDESTLGRYVAKMSMSSIAAEATLGGFKKARRDNRTPFQILGDIIQYGDMDDLETWWEYETASKGRRALTWSRGLRQRFSLGEEKTDEEIAAEEVGDIELVKFDPKDWEEINPHAAQILDLCESNGLWAVIRYLRRNGLPFELIPDTPQRVTSVTP